MTEYKSSGLHNTPGLIGEYGRMDYGPTTRYSAVHLKALNASQGTYYMVVESVGRIGDTRNMRSVRTVSLTPRTMRSPL